MGAGDDVVVVVVSVISIDDLYQLDAGAWFDCVPVVVVVVVDDDEEPMPRVKIVAVAYRPPLPTRESPIKGFRPACQLNIMVSFRLTDYDQQILNAI